MIDLFKNNPKEIISSCLHGYCFSLGLFVNIRKKDYRYEYTHLNTEVAYQPIVLVV
jgi:hypothetical protein